MINGFQRVLQQNDAHMGARIAPFVKGLIAVEICLHLGAHRTGSTSLQVFMNTNRVALARARTAIWGPGRTRTGLFEGLIRDPNGLNDAHLKLAERSVGRIRLQINRAVENGMRRVVVSEENMIGTMVHNLRQDALYGQVQPRLKRFVPAFAGHDLRIGIAIRTYEDYWASALAFRIKGGEAFPTAKRLNALAQQPRRWRHVIADISGAFPRAPITVWSFDALKSHPHLQLDAVTGGKVPAGLSDDGRTNNASLTANEIALVAQERGQTDLAQELMTQPGRYQPFDGAQIQKFRQDYATDLDWLRHGSDGLATYIDPAEGTFGGPQHARGSDHDQETELGRTG